MRKLFEEFMRFITLIFLLVMGFLFFAIATDRVEGCATPGALHEPTEQELKVAMRYHGVLFAEHDEQGQWCFDRDGKQINLFAYQKGGSRW